MRFFLHYTFDFFRSKTQRVEIPQVTTTDHIIDFIISKLYKKEQFITIRIKIDQQYVKIIRGWTIQHYELNQATTLYIEYTDQMNNNSSMSNGNLSLLSNGSQKDSLYIESIIQKQFLDLCQIQEQDEQQIIKQSFSHQDESVTKVNKSKSLINNLVGTQEVTEENNKQNIRGYLDQELILVLKQTKKGNLQKITQILRTFPQLQNQKIRQQLILSKQLRLLNQLGNKGWAALHFAVYYEHIQIVEFLLIKKVDINLQTSDGWTPLQLSIHKRNYKIFSLLLSHPYIIVNKRTRRGTALHIAVRLQLKQFVTLLMQNKADQTILDEYAYSPVQMCTSDQILKILQNGSQNVKNDIIVNNGKILLGNLYKVKSLIYTNQERFLCCNPQQGLLIQYQNNISDEIDDIYYDNLAKFKIFQQIKLKEINHVKMIRKKDRNWLMKKQLSYFQIFTQGRMIYACKNQNIAKQWVKGIFQAVAYVITKQKSNFKKQKYNILDRLYLDDNIGSIRKIPRRGTTNFTSSIVNSQSIKESIIKKDVISLLDRIKKKKDSQQYNLKNSVLLNNNNNKISVSVLEIYTSQKNSDLKINYQNNYNKQQVDSAQKQSTGQNSVRQKQQNRQSWISHQRENNQSIISEDSSIDKQSLHDNIIKFSSFEITRILGQGSFGKVFLAKLKKNNQIYALKALSKPNLVKKKQLRYAVSEANILRKVNSPFIITLYCCFQTQKYLYMCLDYCARGDLSQYLAQKQILQQNQAKIIAAQIVLALEHLHHLKIVYRDLKPQNILLCQDGYIKLTDFGLSKQNVAAYTHSFCGSPAYLSPQMLNKEGVGKQSDIYGLGCILYQMLMGQSPYFNQNVQILYQNIRQGKLKFSPNLSFPARDILMCLLQRDKRKRIKIDQIKTHAFFKGLNFDSLCMKQFGSIEFPKNQIYEQQQDQEGVILNEARNKKFIDQDQKLGSKVNHVLNFSFSRL